MKQARRWTLRELLQPEEGGLFSTPTRIQPYKDEPLVLTQCLRLGDLSSLSQPSDIWQEVPSVSARNPAACGTGLTFAEALIPALGEGVERYSATMSSLSQWLTCSANELGKAALDNPDHPLL